MKWIKNNSGVNKTWLGQVVTDQTYYEIQSHEAVAWGNDSILLSDIATGNALVSKDDSGLTDILDLNKAINYLKSDLPAEVISRTHNVNEDNNLRVRHTGIMDDSITAGTSKNIDYQIQQLTYTGVNKPSIMVGVQFKVSGGNDGDKIDFSIVDIDNILGYGAGLVLDKFAANYYIFTNESTTIREHKAALMPGLYIRAYYNNTGTNDARFICNILRYLDTE